MYLVKIITQLQKEQEKQEEKERAERKAVRRAAIQRSKSMRNLAREGHTMAYDENKFEKTQDFREHVQLSILASQGARKDKNPLPDSSKAKIIGF